MLDLTKLLQTTIRLDREISAKQQLHWQPEQRLENAVVALDVELAEVANTSEWFKVWKIHQGKHATGETQRQSLLYEYVDALEFFLLVASILQWTHLIPLTSDELDEFSQRKAGNRNQEYLAIKNMLYQAYFNHQQASFKHAWHLFLKLGISDLGFSQAEIQKAFEAKNQINEQRQESDY